MSLQKVFVLYECTFYRGKFGTVSYHVGFYVENFNIASDMTQILSFICLSVVAISFVSRKVCKEEGDRMFQRIQQISKAKHQVFA